MQVYALIQFKSPADALKALQSSGLVMMDSKRLVIKPRRITPMKRKRYHHGNHTNESKRSGETAATKYRNLDSNVVELLSQPKPVSYEKINFYSGT